MTRARLAAPAVLAAAVAVLAACSGQSVVPEPQTARQRLAVAEATFSALVDEAIALYDSGRLEGEALERAHLAVVAGDRLLDLAWLALEKGDEPEALDYAARVLRAVADLDREVRAAREYGT